MFVGKGGWGRSNGERNEQKTTPRVALDATRQRANVLQKCDLARIMLRQRPLWFGISSMLREQEAAAVQQACEDDVRVEEAGNMPDGAYQPEDGRMVQPVTLADFRLLRDMRADQRRAEEDYVLSDD